MNGSTTKSRRRPRGVGRPPEADDRDLRRELLDRALECFAREGIAATSMRKIAEEAGVTPAMMHYYFGDKSQLVETLIGERISPAIGAMRDGLQTADDEDPRSLARAFVQNAFQVIAANPWLPPLWVREVLSEGGAFRELLIEIVGSVIPQALAARFISMHAQGRLAAGIDPQQLIISLIGLTMFPAAAAPIWSRMFGQSLSLERLQTHAIAVLDQALAPMTEDG